MATIKAFLSENTNNIVDLALVIIINTSSSYFMVFDTTLRIFMALMAGIY